jgi:hypothetical protein
VLKGHKAHASFESMECGIRHERADVKVQEPVVQDVVPTEIQRSCIATRRGQSLLRVK